VKRTRIKICGITRPEDAAVAIAAGADAIGLVFYEASPRAVTIEQAKVICAQLPPFVTVVALTVNAESDFIEQILEPLPVTLLQFHGDESEQQCQRYGHPYIKAIRMKLGVDIAKELQHFSTAQTLLLDAYQKGVPGGTGERFEWERIPVQYRDRIVLAGGLNPQNIQQAVQQVRPYAVDVSGGVEASHGIKDSYKIGEFIAGVHRADQAEHCSE
jgi:phosphoribosylanthranilate isomerase